MPVERIVRYLLTAECMQQLGGEQLHSMATSGRVLHGVPANLPPKVFLAQLFVPV